MPGENGAVISVQTKMQRRFWFEDTKQGTLELGRIINSENSDTFRHSDPLPVIFSRESTGNSDTLLISESEDFSHSKEIIAENNEFRIFNLETGRRYFLKSGDSGLYSFETEFTYPRYIRADGVFNIRDCGSYKLPGGKRMKQGLLFRGPKLENSVTEAGIEALRSLGIKTELDLRAEAVGELTSSVLGSDVNYVQIPCYGYDEFVNESGRPNLKALLEFLADSGNYPVYFHCAGGADRTGCLAFAVGSILGVDERTLMRDYDLTMLSKKEDDGPDMRRTRWGELFMRLVNELKKPCYGKGTLCDKMLTAVKLSGVDDDTLDKIRRIMTDE